MTNIRQVWHINSGPYQDDEDEGLYFLEVLAEMEDGSMDQVELYTGSLDQTYIFMRAASRNIGPWTADDIVNLVLGSDG